MIKVSQQIRSNYRDVRVRLGCKYNSISKLLERGPLDPGTTFRWIHPNFAECVRIAWARSSEVYARTPTCMRQTAVLYPVIKQVFGVARADIERDVRDTTISRIRHVVMWLMFANGMEIGDIRRAVGKDYHSVAYCIRTHRARFEEFIGVETVNLRRLASNRQTDRSLPAQVHGTVRGDRPEAQA